MAYSAKKKSVKSGFMITTKTETNDFWVFLNSQFNVLNYVLSTLVRFNEISKQFSWSLFCQRFYFFNGPNEVLCPYSRQFFWIQCVCIWIVNSAVLSQKRRYIFNYSFLRYCTRRNSYSNHNKNSNYLAPVWAKYFVRTPKNIKSLAK